MVKRILLFAYIIFSLSLTGNAQFKLGVCWSLYASANAGYNEYMSLHDWVKDYNEVFSDQIKKPLGNIGWGGGYTVGTVIFINTAVLGFEYGNSYSSTYSTQKDPLFPKRYLQQRFEYYGIRLGAGFRTNNNWSFSYNVGIFLQRIYVNSYRKYASGDISFGDESATNGKYRGGNLRLEIFNFELAYDITKNFSVFGSTHCNFGIGEPFNDFGETTRPLINPKNDLPLLTNMSWGADLNMGIKFNIVNRGRVTYY